MSKAALRSAAQIVTAPRSTPAPGLGDPRPGSVPRSLGEAFVRGGGVVGTIAPDPQAPALKHVGGLLATKEAVREALALAKAAHGIFVRQVEDETFVELRNPEVKARRLKRIIETSKDPKEVQSALLEISSVNTEPARRAQVNARSIAQQRFQPVRSALVTLLDAADAGLKELQAEAENSEREFFARWGLSRESTSVSRCFNAARDRLSYFRTLLNDQRTTPYRETGMPILRFFE